MNRFFYTLLLIVTIITSLGAQLVSDYIEELVPNNINGKLDYSNLSLFDPSRFEIQQGFSMSMMNLGNQAVTIAGYNNNITYWANNNLRLTANILLYQPSGNNFGFQTGLTTGPKFAYNAGVIYRPTKNSFFEIRIKNLPNYYFNQKNNFGINTFEKFAPTNNLDF